MEVVFLIIILAFNITFALLLLRMVSKHRLDTQKRTAELLKLQEFTSESFMNMITSMAKGMDKLESRSKFLSKKTREAWVYSTTIREILKNMNKDSEDLIPGQEEKSIDADIESMLGQIESRWKKDSEE